MPKFITTYNQMIRDHKQQFTEFKEIHDLFKQDRQKYQHKFNELGKPIVELIQDYEQQLCGGMERGQFGKFSDQVAEKFWGRVKKDFSHIELVGVEIVNQI